MKHLLLCCIIATLLLNSTAVLLAESGPFDGERFRGRIAYSADGNHNDPDDWAASPVSLAILAECGLKDRVVHFHYNCILPLTDPQWEKIHGESVLGAAKHYGYDESIFFDCRKELDKTVADITRMVNESTADNPLYFIVAGPMQVPVMGILKSDPAKRKHVYCISHSNWNDGLVSRYKFTHTKRDVIETGVNWVQIQDQNRLLAQARYGTPAKPEEFQQYFWMRDSRDPKVQFLWQRMVVSTRPDPSDAGMTYFLVSGDESADPAKLKRLINDHVVPTRIAARSKVRLEAENFVTLDGYEVVIHDRKVTSHGVIVRSTKAEGRISLPFQEPYSKSSARYDVAVIYLDEKDQRPEFELSVNGAVQDSSWRSSGSGKGWTTHTIQDVAIKIGDEILLKSSHGAAQLDYVQLNDRSPKAIADNSASTKLDDPVALPHGDDYEAQHQEYLKYARMNNNRCIVMKNETERFPRTQPQSRRYMWSCVMTGMHTLEAGHDALKRPQLLAVDGRIRKFMEQTQFHSMKSSDDWRLTKFQQLEKLSTNNR